MNHKIDEEAYRNIVARIASSSFEAVKEMYIDPKKFKEQSEKREAYCRGLCLYAWDVYIYSDMKLTDVQKDREEFLGGKFKKED